MEKATWAQRMTRQRRLVLTILEESQDHLDAETIYARAKERDPKISLATVYRALALLKKTGQVQEHRLGEGHGHFERTQPTPHYHFTCQSCGQVIEFESPQVLEAARRLCQDRGLQVTSVQFLVSGVCDRCRPAGAGCDHNE